MAKITTGGSFGGALNYDCDQDQKNNKIASFLDSEGVDMNYHPDGTPNPDMKAIIRSFEIQAAMNPRVTKPVVHIALSFKPEDKPRLTNDYMVKIAREYMQQMGFTNTQYVIHRHEETQNPHIHITSAEFVVDQWRLGALYRIMSPKVRCKAFLIKKAFDKLTFSTVDENGVTKEIEITAEELCQDPIKPDISSRPIDFCSGTYIYPEYF